MTEDLFKIIDGGVIFSEIGIISGYDLNKANLQANELILGCVDVSGVTSLYIRDNSGGGNQTVLTNSNFTTIMAGVGTLLANWEENGTILRPKVAGYALGETGFEVGPVITLQQVLTDAASITYNAGVSNDASVTLTADRTLAALTNVVNGQTGVLTVIQNGTGSWDLAFGATYVVISGNIADIGNQAAGKRSFVTWKYDGASAIAYLWINQEL